MNLSEFHDTLQALDLTDTESKWTEAFWKTVNEVFGEDCEDFESQEKVCKLFYGKGKSLSKAQYYRRRHFVRMFYDWLIEKGAVGEDFRKTVYGLRLQDVVSNAELYHYYFKDLDEVLDFITFVGSMKGMGDADDLLNIKAIAILSWYQFDLSELQELRKSDLHPDTLTVSVGEKRVHLSAEHLSVLTRFAELDKHKGFPSQKPQIYQPSVYLIRSARQTCLNPNNVQKAIQRFNSVAVQHGKKELSILSLRRNGIFRQVYDSDDGEENKTVGVLIQQLIGCDTAFAFGYKEFYGRWKQFIMEGDDGS